MRLEDLNNSIDVESLEELKRAIAIKYDGGVNSFWLSFRGQEYPCLSILVKNSYCYAIYFPEDGHPGWCSVGNPESHSNGESTVFFMDKGNQEQEIPNDYIIPFDDAEKVACDFFTSKSRSKAIEWFEL